VPDPTLRAAVFGRIAEEHVRTVSAYLDITGLPTLLADNPTLARSIRNRFPYLDPLNHLQVSCCGAFAPARPTSAPGARSTSRSTGSPRA